MMNHARAGKSPRLVRTAGQAAVLACLLAGSVGCAAVGPQDEAASPLAPEVQALVDANRRYPSWNEFPRATPAPAPEVIAGEVAALNADRASLASEVARIDWTIHDPAALAAEAAEAVRRTTIAPVTRQTQAEIEEFNRRARERGRAPPPVDRR